jgi:hypothetical protein
MIIPRLDAMLFGHILAFAGSFFRWIDFKVAVDIANYKRIHIHFLTSFL